MSYMHIDNLYKIQDILMFRECYAMEKIHGTSAHITWDGCAVRFFSGGVSHDSFVKLFDEAALQAKFVELFGADHATVYGEAYGGSCQGMSKTYGPNLRFIVFEVRVGDSWLNVPNAENVAQKLGLEFVPYEKIPATIEAIDAQRDRMSVQAERNGCGTDHIREGVVLRPLVECTKNNGARIICKRKRSEFSERASTPKVIDPEKLEVLKNAQAIAEEWVTPMRLEHVVDKLPYAIGMEHTRDVIAAMQEDVTREAAGEIVVNKEVLGAIGRRTAMLWKKRIESSLHS